ncbi:MAG: GntR family transcriptional regulator [Gammaproteobacteria bacterium]|nr:GntR family transcriptional regulator [Gammaproteobacteria bacterium]
MNAGNEASGRIHEPIETLPHAGEGNPLRVERTSQTLSHLTAETLRHAIVKRHFKPNQRLVERELCEQTGVSRTCVREALRQLEAEGLVRRVPNKGLRVASVSLDEARQLYEVRAAIEAKAGHYFAHRAGDADIEDLRDALRAVERTAHAEDIVPYVEALDQFYDVLLQGSGNEVAAQILRTLRARINYLRAMTAAKADGPRRDETARLLRGIVDAADARDATALAAQCEAFVERSAAFAIAVLGELKASEDDSI